MVNMINKKRKFVGTFALVIITVVLAVVFLVSCKKTDAKNENIVAESTNAGIEINTKVEITEQRINVEDLYDFKTNYKDRKVIVAYFSATGNTEIVAKKIAEFFKCDTVEIEPVKPYSTTDLTSNDPSTRPMRESMFDPLNPSEEPEEEADVDPNIVTSLPAIKRKNLNRYNTIILGYPIWYGDAPRVIYTFVSENNLKDKVIIPFCTSDNDGIDLSVNKLAEFSNANFMSGKRFDVNVNESEIEKFFTEIGVDINTWD